MFTFRLSLGPLDQEYKEVFLIDMWPGTAHHEYDSGEEPGSNDLQS